MSPPGIRGMETFTSVALDMTGAGDEAALLRMAEGAPARIFGSGRFQFVRQGEPGDAPVQGGAGPPLGFLRPVDLPGDPEASTLLAAVARLTGVCLLALRQKEPSAGLWQGLNTDRAYFEELFEGAPEAIVVLDQADRVVRMNSEFMRLFGYTAAEAEGRTINELIVPADGRQEGVRLTQRAAAGETVQEDAVRCRRDGSTLHVQILGTRLVVDGQLVGVYAIYRDITAQKETEEALRRLSTTDDLTGLHNRRGFFLLAEQQRRLAIRKQAELLLVYIDIDDFKAINDTHGHQVGDQVLTDMADLLRRCYRDSDIVARISDRDGVLARMGGDEFVVLAVDAGEQGQQILLSRLRERLAEYNRPRPATLQVSLSVGAVRVMPEPHTTIDDVLAAADRLMYQDKRGSPPL
jgi:diguanylate cyclase (GGDEF)-like protein/PAS domain S-box-containing protein